MPPPRLSPPAVLQASDVDTMLGASGPLPPSGIELDH